MKKEIPKKFFNGKICIFIDAANVIYSLRNLGWKIDYKLLQRFFEAQGELVDIFFYTAYFDSDLGLKNLLEMLSRKGFIIRSKEVKQIRTPGGIIHKANCDVELAMDVMTHYSRLDTAVIMSGDSDFTPLIKFLKSKKKKVVVISTRGHVSKEVVESADIFLHFGLFRDKWELKSKNPAKRGS
ncbi:MAG: NYN domain-containing protein [Patescibacteria group bacterium]